MTESFYRRHMLVQDGPDWGVFAFANDTIQLDLGRAGLILPESMFRRFCDFVLMAQHVARRGTLTSTTEPLRIARYCPRTNIMTLSFEQTTFRFRPYEFARLAQVCKQTINTDAGIHIQKIVDTTDADGREDVEVCMIETQGCAVATGQDCFCQCDDTACNQWIYYEQTADAWQRRWSAGKRDVTAGMVVGWVWGDTQAADVAQPVLRSFEDICLHTTPTPTATATATRKPMPTETSSPSPSPTSSATATATDLPTATVLPTTTDLPTATVLPTVTEQPSAVPAQMMSNNAEHSHTPIYLPFVLLSAPSMANTPPDILTPTLEVRPTTPELPTAASIDTPPVVLAEPTATMVAPEDVFPSATLEATSAIWFPRDAATAIPISATLRTDTHPPVAGNHLAMAATTTPTVYVPSPTYTAQRASNDLASRLPPAVAVETDVSSSRIWFLLSLIVGGAVILIVLTIVVYLRQQRAALLAGMRLTRKKEEQEETP